jgi:hypothetical protein
MPSNLVRPHRRRAIAGANHVCSVRIAKSNGQSGAFAGTPHRRAFYGQVLGIPVRIWYGQDQIRSDSGRSRTP